MSGRVDPGVIPSVQDILAGGVVAVVYYLRLGAAGDPQVRVPDLLIITTDFVLPSVAAGWLWVAAMFVLIEKVGE